MVCWHHARGGEGAADLGKALAAACEQPANFRFLYPLELSIKVPRPALSCQAPGGQGLARQAWPAHSMAAESIVCAAFRVWGLVFLHQSLSDVDLHMQEIS